VTYSIERYNLDFPQLMDSRKVVWDACWQQIQQYKRELSRVKTANGINSIAHYGAKERAKAIREMTYADKQFSAVARACILSTGDPRVIRILQTM